MKAFVRSHAAAVLMVVVPGLISAAEPDTKPHAPLLLTHEELQKRLAEPSLRILDARPRAEYEKGHIPGALWVDVKAVQALAKPATFADERAWARGLASLGIGQDTEVYVYDADRQHDAGRVWWLLSYAGVERTGLVDGGFPLWERAGRPVSTEVPNVEPREPAVRFHPRRSVSRDEIRSAVQAGNVALVDARSAAEFRGDAEPKGGGRAGHIPSARSLDAYSLVDQDGRFLAEEALRERIRQAGIRLDQPIIVYSQGGGRSGAVVFALRRLGIRARHYYPGLSDWARDPSAPVARGDAPERTE